MNTNRYQHPLASRSRQAGLATLLLILIVMTGLTAVTFYAANSGFMKQRITANEMRAKEALQAAEIGTNMAINYVKANVKSINSTAAGGWMQAGSERWESCSNAPVSTAIPCGNGATNYFGADYVYHVTPGSTTAAVLSISDPVTNYATPAVGDAPYQVYLVAKCADDDEDGSCDSTAPSLANDALFVAIAQGWSADQTGRATTQQGFKTVKALANVPDAPFIAVNDVDLSGSIEIVANPNGGGPGVPLSAWTESEVTIGASAYTCYPGEYLASGNPYADPSGTIVQLCDNTAGAKCSCSSAAATGQISSNSKGENEDIVDNVSPFPDLFEYVFGVSRDEYQDIKNMADVRANCSGLGPTSSGLIWIEGACDITGAPSDQIGTAANPVLLVVEDAELKMNGQEAFGLIFLFDLNEDGAGATLDANGNCQVYGAMVAEGAVPHTNGTFIVRYEETVLQNVMTTSSGAGIGRLPGAWLDYY